MIGAAVHAAPPAAGDDHYWEGPDLRGHMAPVVGDDTPVDPTTLDDPLVTDRETPFDISAALLLANDTDGDGYVLRLVSAEAIPGVTAGSVLASPGVAPLSAWEPVSSTPLTGMGDLIATDDGHLVVGYQHGWIRSTDTTGDAWGAPVSTGTWHVVCAFIAGAGDTDCHLLDLNATDAAGCAQQARYYFCVEPLSLTCEGKRSLVADFHDKKCRPPKGWPAADEPDGKPEKGAPHCFTKLAYHCKGAFLASGVLTRDAIRAGAELVPATLRIRVAGVVAADEDVLLDRFAASHRSSVSEPEWTDLNGKHWRLK